MRKMIEYPDMSRMPQHDVGFSNHVGNNHNRVPGNV